LIEDGELARLVKLYPILQELPPRLQHSLYDSGYTVHLKAGETIFDAYHPIHFFYFLTSGSIRVIRLGQEREILLYRVQPGETCILSVFHILADMPYQAKAFAESLVTGIAIPEGLFIQIVEGYPLFCSYLFRSFSGRLADLLALLEAVSFNRLDQRLAWLLLSEGTTIHATHSQLADELGSVREVISRILKEFENKGFVKLERGKVKILNRPALEKIATSVNGSSTQKAA
jgi:CRP/FNR family transcriptional regulator